MKIPSYLYPGHTNKESNTIFYLFYNKLLFFLYSENWPGRSKNNVFRDKRLG
jgi:hypothetical protein